MGLPQEELLPIKDVADRLKQSETYVLSRLRLREFHRVIIEKTPDSGGPWTAHYYFSQDRWPYGEKSTFEKGSSGTDFYYRLSNEDHEDENWLKYAETILIPLEAVQAYEDERDIRTDSPTVLPLNLSKLDASKMSECLRIAIAADTYLYAQKHIRQNQGDRNQIDSWLMREYGDHLSKNQRNAITSVVNRRKGGPPFSSK